MVIYFSYNQLDVANVSLLNRSIEQNKYANDTKWYFLWNSLYLDVDQTAVRVLLGVDLAREDLVGRDGGNHVGRSKMYKSITKQFFNNIII